MRIHAKVASSPSSHAAEVRTGDHTQTVPVRLKSTGPGSAINGGEFLMLAIATCYCNDLYREAQRLAIPISAVEVEASAEFPGIGLAATNIRYRAKVTSSASPSEVAHLLDVTDAVAEVHNTIRAGVAVEWVAEAVRPAVTGQQSPYATETVSPGHMSTDVEALRDFFAAVNRNDMQAATKDFDPDLVRVEPPGFPTAGTYRGIAAVKAHLAAGRGTWAEGSCEPEKFLVNGDKVVVYLYAWVRLKDTDRWIGGRFADGFVFRKGKITDYISFAERRDALQWAGIEHDESA